jgi:outer membrane lipoprotein LolB
MHFFMTARSRAGCLSMCMMLAGLALSGCAGLAPLRTPAEGATATAQSAQTGQATQPTRRFHPVIEISGRLSLRYDRNGSEQAIDGKFSWNQARDETRITLLTPFGQTLATIEITPAGSVLRQANQPPRTEANVDALTASTLGWPLPVAGLRDWLQGFAVDERGTPYVAAENATGDAAYVKTADGWLIHYPVWEPDATALARPKRIDLQRQTSQAGKVALRIVIDQWQPQG